MVTKRGRVWIGGAAAAVVLVALALASMSGGGSGTGGHPGSGVAAGAGEGPNPVAAALVAVPRRQPGDPLALGRVDAPVVVAEWGDFQCPYCRAFNQDTEPALLRRYVDSGQVRLEWHDFAYLGPESILGARAARAAGMQGEFWAFHDALYRDHPPENTGAVTAASLAATAARLGLDVPRFNRDYANPALTAEVAADQQAGARIGITGVPSFVIGDQLIVGAQPVVAFQQVIDAALTRGR